MGCEFVNKLFRIVPEVFIAVVLVMSGFGIVGGLTIIFAERFLELPLELPLDFYQRVLLSFYPFLFLLSFIAETHIKDSEWRVLK